MRAASPVDPRDCAAQRRRIVDVVFGSVGEVGRRRPIGLALVAALVAHGTLGVMALGVEPSLESWSANLALQVHAQLGHEATVELARPSPPAEPAREAQLEPEHPPTKVARTPRGQPREVAPPPPARAGRILAQAPDPSAAVDLTGNTFVTGSASAYAGGATTSHGTNPHAVRLQDVDLRTAWTASGSRSLVRGAAAERAVAVSVAGGGRRSTDQRTDGGHSSCRPRQWNGGVGKSAR